MYRETGNIFFVAKGKRHFATVNIEINIQSLAEKLGRAACGNKSRKSKLAAGVSAIVLKHEEKD